MADLQVTCIEKQPLQNPFQGITHLGGRDWRRERDEVAEAIEAGTDSFYTVVNGRRAEIRVVNGPFGRYVRSYADGRWNDTLLALGDFPSPRTWRDGATPLRSQ